jgi:hypothetical protein
MGTCAHRIAAACEANRRAANRPEHAVVPKDMHSLGAAFFDFLRTSHAADEVAGRTSSAAAGANDGAVRQNPIRPPKRPMNIGGRRWTSENGAEPPPWR